MPSYSQVFSAAFIQYTASTPNNEFAVPEGFTAVIRQVSAYQDIGGFTCNVSTVDAAGAPELVVVGLAGFVEFVSQQQEGRWVVPGGGFILLNVSSLGSDPHFYVGGYLLRNTLT